MIGTGAEVQRATDARCRLLDVGHQRSRGRARVSRAIGQGRHIGHARRNASAFRGEPAIRNTTGFESNPMGIVTTLSRQANGADGHACCDLDRVAAGRRVQIILHGCSG